jgi:N-acetylglucosamine-6-phosphate deacetylase
MQRFIAGDIVNASGRLGPAEITVEDGVVTEVRRVSGTAGSSHAAGGIAVPGFIDMHTHGGAGHDVMDGDHGAWDAIARHHLEQGTTSFIASTLTAPLADIESILVKMRDYLPESRQRSDDGERASLLGIHLEGPWISPERAGAQNPAHMHAPDDRSFELVRRHADLIRMVTFSYHFETSPQLLALLLEHDIIAASGHDQTLDERALDGFSRGLTYVTHIYSMTSGFQRSDGRKYLGTLEMALMTPGVAVEVIADGHHITEPFWRFIRHNKSPHDIVIVSDSMRWAGLQTDPGGVISMGGVDVIVEDGVAWLADRSAYAGSVSSMHDMFRRLVCTWNVPLPDAVRMTSWNQALRLGLTDQLGSIEPGKTADFVLLDEELHIVNVVKSGRVLE